MKKIVSIYEKKCQGENTMRFLNMKYLKDIGLFVMVISLLFLFACKGSDDNSVLATYQFTSPGWATFGIALPKGTAFKGLKVGELVTQNDIKNRWSDGSIKYAILTVNVQEEGDYEIYKGNLPSGLFTPAIPSAELTLDIEGQGDFYKSVLPNTVSTDLWLNGPLVREWRVRDIPKQNETEHAFLSNTWDVRVYNDGTGTVDLIVENVRDAAVATGIVYATEIKVNDVVVYEHSAIRSDDFTMTWSTGNTYTTNKDHGLINGSCLRYTSGPHTGTVVNVARRNTAPANSVSISHTFSDRQSLVDIGYEQIFYHAYGVNWRKTFDIDGFVRSEFKTDFTPFIEANAIPEYRSQMNTGTGLMRGNGEWEGMAPLGLSNLATYVPEVGGREEIGTYPAWQARFLVNQTPELKELLLAMGNVAGSFSAHFAKNNPAEIWTVDEKPDYWLDNRMLNTNNKPLNNMVGRRFSYENAHAGSLAYIPYLVSGDRYFADEMLYYANFAIMHTNPSQTYTTQDRYRQGERGLLWRNETRGMAWALRNVTDAANYLPDSSQYQAMLRRVVRENLRDLDRYLKEMESDAPIVITIGSVSSITSGTAELLQTSPWQIGFLAWAVAHAVLTLEISDKGNAGIYARDRLFKMLFEPAIKKTGFEPEYITAYRIIMAELVNGNWEFFKTWDKVFEMNKAHNSNYNSIPAWGYGAEIWPALMMALKTGYPDAHKAHEFFLNPATHSISFYNNMSTSGIYQGYALADIACRCKSCRWMEYNR